MHRLFCYLLFLSFIFSNNSFASPNHAKVILLRGQVTFTTTKSEAKMRLQKGDKIPEGATIKTYQNSMAKLLFKDKTTSIIGPKSTLKITQTPEKDKDKVGVISLIKGKIRTKFIPNPLDPETGKSKLFIKTKTAAMGIRGTDFSAIYNPSLDLTTTITFEGDVLLGKLNPGDLATGLKGKSSNLVSPDQKSNNSPDSNLEEGSPLEPQELQERLEKAVTDEAAVSIKAGNFSSFNARKKTEGPSIPTLLSPRQFKKLKKNQNFKEASTKEKKSLKKGKKYRPMVPPGMSPEIASAGEGEAKKAILKSIGKKVLIETFKKKLKKPSSNKGQKELPNFLDGKSKQKVKKTKNKLKTPTKKSKSKTIPVSFRPGTIISPDGIPIEPPRGSQFDPNTGTYVMPSFLFKLDSSGNPVFATEGLKMNEKGRIIQDKKDKKNKKKTVDKESKKGKPNSKKNKKGTSLSEKESKGVDFKDVLKKVEKGLAKGSASFDGDIKQRRDTKNKKGKNKKSKSKGRPNNNKTPGEEPDKGAVPPPPPAPKPPAPKPPKVRPPNIIFKII